MGMMRGPGKTAGTQVVFIGSAMDGVGGIPSYQRGLCGAFRSAEVLGGVLSLNLDGSHRAAGREFLRALRFIARERPTFIVLGHVNIGAIGIAARLMGIPFAVMTYGIEVWGPWSLMQYTTLRVARTVWPISSFTARVVSRRYPGTRLGEPLGGRVALPSKAAEHPVGREFRILTIAAMQQPHYKGLDTCIDAVMSLPADITVDYRIVGRGVDTPQLRVLVPEPTATRRVTVVGEVGEEQLADETRAADVVVLVSRFRAGRDPLGEGLGLALLEASAFGVPVIGSEVGGSVDAVLDGVSGYLIRPGDSHELAARLVVLARDPDLRTALGAAGRRWVAEHHSAEAFDARVHDALESSKA